MYNVHSILLETCIHFALHDKTPCMIKFARICKYMYVNVYNKNVNFLNIYNNITSLQKSTPAKSCTACYN